MTAAETTRRRSRPLAFDIVEAFAERMRDGRLAPGDKLPAEAEIMVEFGVSRTVVREVISKLQAGGQVQTRHGVGSFVLGDSVVVELPGVGAAVRMSTLIEVVAVLELRLGVETETAALAAVRRSDTELQTMYDAQSEFGQALRDGHDTVKSDLNLHLEIARATHNSQFFNLVASLGRKLIPRSRIDTSALAGEGRREYLKRVHAEHDSIVSAIANHDPEAARAAMRTHLSNSRERLRRLQRESAGAR